MKKISLAIALSFFIAPAALAQTSGAHLPGTHVSEDGAIHRIITGAKKGYPSMVVFSSYGLSLADVVPANDADRALSQTTIAPFADGSLVVDQGAVFIMYDGRKYGFTSREVFLGLGYDFANVIAADISQVPLGGLLSDAQAGHSYGTLVRDTNGTIYVAASAGFMGIPSMNVFRSHKFNLAKVVEMNEADRLAAKLGNLNFASGTLVEAAGTIYFLENGNKRPFHSSEEFLSQGYRFDQAIVVSESEIAALTLKEIFE